MIRSAARATRSLGVAALALGACAAGAQQNMSFETIDDAGLPLGWIVAGGATVASDAAAADGQRSLRVARAADAGGVVRVTQRVAADSLRPRSGEPRAVRLVLSGLARTAGAGALPALWLRIDGARGPLFLDSSGFGREPADESGRGAVGRQPPSPDWRRYELELPFPADVGEVAFGVSVRGDGSAWFDALELTAVVTDDRPTASAAATRYVDAALALMREHSLNRADVDWPALRAATLEHARGAVTPADAHLAVRFAVRELGDRHSYLQSAAATRALSLAAVSNARTGAPPSPPRGRRLPGGAAYLEVPSFAGGTHEAQVEFAEQLKNIVQAHDKEGVCGWVVDLRRNTGGNLWPMLAGLGPLLGDGELAASVYPDGRRVGVWHRDGQAGFGEYTQLRVRSAYRAAPAPVAVLQGGATASSAEVLAVAFRGRSDTRSFGAPTRGLAAGNRTFALSDGASLVLTVAATSDAAGRVYSGAIEPDETVASPGDRRGAGWPADAALAAATAWLAAGGSCP